MSTRQKASSFISGSSKASSAVSLNGNIGKAILALAFFVASGLGLFTIVDRLYYPATSGAVLEAHLKGISSDVQRIEGKVDELLRELRRGSKSKGATDGD